MKKLITVILFIFISSLSFGQIKKAGNFYEGNDLWKRDSVSVKQLTNKFNLDITKLETVQFFKQFKFNKQLHDEYSHTTYVYTLYKKTGVVIMESSSLGETEVEIVEGIEYDFDDKNIGKNSFRAILDIGLLDVEEKHIEPRICR